MISFRNEQEGGQCHNRDIAAGVLSNFGSKKKLKWSCSKSFRQNEMREPYPNDSWSVILDTWKLETKNFQNEHGNVLFKASKRRQR